MTTAGDVAGRRHHRHAEGDHRLAREPRMDDHAGQLRAAAAHGLARRTARERHVGAASGRQPRRRAVRRPAAPPAHLHRRRRARSPAGSVSSRLVNRGRSRCSWASASAPRAASGRAWPSSASRTATARSADSCSATMSPTRWPTSRTRSASSRAGAALRRPGEEAAQAEPEQRQRNGRQRHQLVEQLRPERLRAAECRPAVRRRWIGPGQPATSSASTTLRRPESDCPAAARVISVASCPSSRPTPDDQHRDADDDPVAEAGQHRHPAAPGQQRDRQHLGHRQQRSRAAIASPRRSGRSRRARSARPTRGRRSGRRTSTACRPGAAGCRPTARCRPPAGGPRPARPPG